VFSIKYTLADGSERFDNAYCMASALYCAIECPIENAVRVEVRGPNGYCQAWRL
jgi:hypothetical protein